MLKLFLCLSKKLQKYILIFENTDLDIVRVSKTLKECTVAIGNYLFRSKVSGSRRSMEYYEQYQEMNRLLSLPQNSEEYIKTLMNSEEFEAYFLLKNSQFKDKSKWEPEFSDIFFDRVSNFLRTAIKQIRMRLPDSDSALMLADSFLLNTEQEIDNIRRLGSQFNNVRLPLDIAYFDQELEDLNFSFPDMN